MVACVSVSMHVEASSFTAQRRCAPGALLAQTSRRGGRRRRSCRVGEAPKRSTVRDAEADRASSSGVGCRAVSDVANGVVARRFTRRKKDVGYEKALRHWRSCEYDLARQSFEEFLDEKPMHSLAWVSYSRLVLSQSGFKAARRVLFKGIQNAGTYGMAAMLFPSQTIWTFDRAFHTRARMRSTASVPDWSSAPSPHLPPRVPRRLVRWPRFHV